MMRSRRLAGLLAFALLVVPAFAVAQSQATTGVIEGTVSDPSGAPIAGATVIVKNTATNLERTLATDADGRFRALLLPLGPYKVTVSLTGFATLVREGIVLTVGQSANLALSLKVSSVQEEIVVQADSPVIETTRAESSTRINSASIQGLPNNGRNFLDFTKLTPGVSIVQGPDGDELTINGQKGIYNNVSVDGADFNNPFFGEQRGGQRPAFTFNMDAVQEVVVVASGANAEFGRSNGGFVNVVTKSGTNQMHGTLHAYFKDDSLSSAPKKADGSEADKFPFSQQQYGFTLGGPIVKDKAFYFVALDYQNGDSTKQTDPSRIEQRVVDYFSALGSPGENGSIERTNDARVFLGKIDWQLSPKHLATIRYNYTWSEQKNGTFDVDSWGVSANAIEKDDSNAVTGSLISNLSSSLLNEFRFQWARENRPRPYDGPDITGQSRPLPDTAFDFGRAYRFGEPFFIPVDYFDERIQFNDNISVIKGRHSMKFGVEYNRVHSNQTFRGFQNGRYIFGSTDGFLNYARNPKYVECSNGATSETGACPAGADITGPLLLFLQQFGVGGLSAEEAGTQDIPQTELAFFAQDKWQPNRSLTVSYGLRWEMQQQADMITPANEVFYAPLIGQTVTNSFGTWKFPSNGEIPSDKSMWQPRLGISWDPKADGKTVVRLNGGLFYGRVPGLALASSRSTNGSRAQNAFRASFFNGFGVTPPTYPNLLPAEAGQGVPDHPGVFVFNEDFQNPRTWSASASIEREVVTDLARAGPVQLRQGRAPHALPRAERHGLRLPVGHRHQRDERHRLRQLRRRRTHERRVDGQEQLQRGHLRPHQALRPQLPVPGQLHAVLGQVRRRQRARPVHLPLHRLQQPRRRVRLLGPRPAPPAERGAAVARARPGERQPALLVPLGPAAVAERDGGGVAGGLRPGLRPHPVRRLDRRAQHGPQGQRVLVARPARSRASSGSASGCRSSRSSRSSTCSTRRTCSCPRPPTWCSTSTARSRAASALRARRSSARG